MSPIATPRPSRRRLIDTVIERIQQQVSLGVLRPGDRLPTETELTEAFGVSRTTVREAVVVLAHAGLLQVRQGDGTYVVDAPSGREALDTRLKRAAALDVYEARRPLDVEAARLAATRRTASDVRRMRELLAERDRLRSANDVRGFVAADVGFHTTIAVATRNAVLADLYRTFSGALMETLIHLARDEAAADDTTELHHKLLDAIDRRDANKAAALADRLIEGDTIALRNALMDRGARAPSLKVSPHEPR
jgi:GntR family transcriptional repressor for pyruvate dehydrogenase complex